MRFLRPAVALATIVAALVAASGCAAPDTAHAEARVLPHTANRWPHVTVDDRTAGLFPVRQAMANWKVPVSYGPCADAVWSPDAVCILVRPAPTLPSGEWMGATTMYPGAGPVQFVDVALLQSTEFYGDPWRLQLTCHELGHALGLDHDTTGGCMKQVVDYGLHPTPSAAEFALIKELYSK